MNSIYKKNLSYQNPFMRTRIWCLLLILFFNSCDFYSSDYYNRKAEKLEKKEKYREAIKYLNKAIKKDSTNLYALINRGVDYSMLNEYQKAIDDYSRIIKIDSQNTLAYYNRGKNKARLNKHEGALEDFEKAIRTKGNDSIYIEKESNYFLPDNADFDVRMEEIRLERGMARLNLDSLKLAFQDFSFCVQKNYGEPICHYCLGYIYLSYSNIKEGCAELERAKDWGNPNAQNLIDQYCKNR